MKIAISSKNNSISSELDSRFGRCLYFAVFNTENKSVEFIRNDALNIEEGAGPVAVQQLASLGIKKIVSRDFGIKIKNLCSDLNIQLIPVREKYTIEQIIRLLNF